MYLFWLTTFKKVIDEGSYTRAAAGLFVSQSAVSQQVRQLEKLFGAKLIQMSGRRPELTEAGKQVYKFASSMESEYDETRQAIDALLGRSRSHVIIVSAMPVLLHRLPAVIKRFWAEHPEVGIETAMRTGDEISNSVKTGLADVGITGLDFDSSLEALPAWTDTVIAVAPPDHPFAGMTSLSPAAIAEQRVVIGGGAEIRRLVDDWFEARGAGLARVMELPSFEGLRNAVIETAGVAFLPRDGLSEDLASGQLVPIDIEGFDVSAQAYVVHRHDLHEAAQWLVQLLAEQEAMPLTT